MSQSLAGLALVLLPVLSACAARDRDLLRKSPDVVVPEPPPGPAAEPTPLLTDDNVLRAVRQKLESDSAVDAARIEVTMKEGNVVLSGTVDHALAAERALTAVESIRGVRDVVSRVQVRAPEVPDRELEQAIREALKADPATDSYELAVSANRGVIVLEGVVQSVAEQRCAEATARSLRGVREIDNHIRVAPAPYRADAKIKADVERRLATDAHLDDEEITVAISNGHVVLQGKVDSIFERNRVHRATSLSGARSVDDSGVEIDARHRDRLRRGSSVELGDEELRSAVSDALRLNPRVGDSGILVLAAAGGVELKGITSTLTAKRAAETEARNTAGVWTVTNRLTVQPKLVSRDDDLAVLIRSKLRQHAALSAERLDVSVRDGRARLEGSVQDTFERQQAEAAAAGVPGVRGIDNRLVVSAQSQLLDDETLERRIEAALFWDSRIDEGNVHVDVFDGMAIVAGTVPDRAMYDAVLENVRSVGPLGVEDRLRWAFMRDR